MSNLRWLFEAYTLSLESLYNSEGPRVVHILHDNPIDCLLVFAVDAGSFDELCFHAGYRVWVLVAIEVNGERVDHFEGLVRWNGKRQ